MAPCCVCVLLVVRLISGTFRRLLCRRARATPPSGPAQTMKSTLTLPSDGLVHCFLAQAETCGAQSSKEILAETMGTATMQVEHSHAFDWCQCHANFLKQFVPGCEAPGSPLLGKCQ
eukprot:5621202-Prorocentrum_lima.AAC.1